MGQKQTCEIDVNSVKQLYTGSTHDIANPYSITPDTAKKNINSAETIHSVGEESFIRPPGHPPTGADILAHQPHAQINPLEDRAGMVKNWVRNGQIFGPMVAAAGLGAWKGLNEPLGGMFFLWGLGGWMASNYMIKHLEIEEPKDKS